jgi:hypothetical protein
VIDVAPSPGRQKYSRISRADDYSQLREFLKHYVERGGSIPGMDDRENPNSNSILSNNCNFRFYQENGLRSTAYLYSYLVRVHQVHVR